MHAIDYFIVAGYLVVLLWLGLRSRQRDNSGRTAADFILDGRRLTLPAFVATLVSTWYGGILGVGEYTFLYGVSNWLVFGVPYYAAALIFAFFLSKKAREKKLITIPEQLAKVYDQKTSVAGAVILFMMTVPAAYVLMLGLIGTEFFGWPLWAGVVAGTLFSLVYVYLGAFRSVVITDIFQFVLMFLGFISLLIVVVLQYGGFEFLVSNLPETHLTWHGGNSGWYIASWYVLALTTLIEPSFYQRCYAAKTPNVAFKGILISVVCWIGFDFLTTVCGLYARAILPELDNAAASFPALALKTLPAGLVGLFAVALLSTVMSTVDSFSFLAASTFSYDIVSKVKKLSDPEIIYYSRVGLIISAVLAVGWALFVESVVDIWRLFGSIGAPALLVPVFFSFVGKRRLPSKQAFVSIICSAGLSFFWYLSKFLSDSGSFWLGLEPIFPGLGLSIIIFIIFSKRESSSMLSQQSS